MHAIITALPGDGIGPDVVHEGLRVLRAIGEQYNHTFEVREALIGGCAIDATGEPLPQATLDAVAGSAAVLLGAVGGPKWDIPGAKVRPEQGLLGIRKALGLFANLRPVTLHPRLIAASPLRPELLAGVDLLVVRELTGGVYFGEKRRAINEQGVEYASDLCIYSVPEIERIVRVAAELARGRRKKLTSVDKFNVLETSRLWRSVATRIMAEEYPDVQVEHILVDACAMHLLRRPADFDVIVTENMFGDILTDEASMLAGSMGMLPSASVGATDHGPRTTDHGPRIAATTDQALTSRATDTTLSSVVGGPSSAAAATPRLGLYEPIHGSAPDIAGKGIANPLATILSVALLLRLSLGLEREAQAVEAAVERALADGFVTGDVAAPGERTYRTEEVGAAVAARVA